MKLFKALRFEKERKGKIEIWYDEIDKVLIMYDSDKSSWSFNNGKTWDYWSLGGPDTYKNHNYAKYQFVGFLNK